MDAARPHRSRTRNLFYTVRRAYASLVLFSNRERRRYTLRTKAQSAAAAPILRWERTGAPYLTCDLWCLGLSAPTRVMHERYVNVNKVNQLENSYAGHSEYMRSARICFREFSLSRDPLAMICPMVSIAVSGGIRAAR